MAESRKPPRQRMPAGLVKNGHGQQLWHELTERVEFTDIERRILANACFTLDRIQRMRRAMGNDVLAEGSQGQLIAHPLLREIRMDEKHFCDLIDELDVPDQFAQETLNAGTESGARSSQMRAVVSSRWNKAFGQP